MNADFISSSMAIGMRLPPGIGGGGGAAPSALMGPRYTASSSPVPCVVGGGGSPDQGVFTRVPLKLMLQLPAPMVDVASSIADTIPDCPSVVEKPKLLPCTL